MKDQREEGEGCSQFAKTEQGLVEKIAVGARGKLLNEEEAKSVALEAFKQQNFLVENRRNQQVGDSASPSSNPTPVSDRRISTRDDGQFCMTS